jgi:hypothetical protein
LAINVTVLGAADGTITIPITSAANAAVAQTALSGISMAVAAGTLTQTEYGGTGTGSPPGATTGEIGVVEQGGTTALAPFATGDGCVAAVLDGAAMQVVLTGVSRGEIVASGTAGAVVGNLGINTEVFFGGGNNGFVAIGDAVLDLAPTAQVYLDGNGYFDVSFGATTIFAGTGATMDVVNTGSASNTINLEPASGSNQINMLALSGTAATSATVNAAGAGLAVVQNGGAAVINANDSNVTVFGVPAAGDGWWSGGGSVTLFGGSGTDDVSNGTGFFQAGSGGGSLLVSSTLPGAATLVGGGGDDTLMAQGAGDIMLAGSGNETLVGGDAPVIEVGFAGTEPAGAVTDMTGAAGGGNIFFIGNGTTSITGNHGAAGGNVYSQYTDGPKTAEISDFVSALGPSGAPVANPDMISLAKPGGGSYQLVTSASTATELTADQVGYSCLSIGGSIATQVQFGDGATWTLFDCTLHAGDFH